MVLDRGTWKVPSVAGAVTFERKRTENAEIKRAARKSISATVTVADVSQPLPD